MTVVDLSAFMQEVIERVGRQPDLVEDHRCVWKYGKGEIALRFGSENADIEVGLTVDTVEEDDLIRHTYELTDVEEWNGMSDPGGDLTMYTYDHLVDAVGGWVTASLNLAA